MSGHDVFGMAIQEIAEGRVGALTIALGYDQADNGPDGEDEHIRYLLRELRAGRMTDARLDAWEARWVELDAASDRWPLKGSRETAAVLGEALDHLERAQQRPTLPLAA